MNNRNHWESKLVNEFKREIRSKFQDNRKSFTPPQTVGNVLKPPLNNMLSQEGFQCLQEDFDMAELFDGINKPSPKPELEKKLEKTQESAEREQLESVVTEESQDGETEYSSARMKTAKAVEHHHLEEVQSLKQALHEVRGQMLKYREFFNNSSDMCMYISPDLLIIKEFNQAAAKQLGYQESELNGAPLNMFIAPEDRPLIRSFILSLFSKNRSSIMVQFMTKEKSRIPLALSGTIIRDGDTILSVMISAKKVTYSENHF